MHCSFITRSRSVIQGRRSKGDCQNPTSRTCGRVSVGHRTEDRRVDARKEAHKGISQGRHSEEKVETRSRGEGTPRQRKS